MKILFVCKDNPYGLGGGNYATRAYLQALSDLSDGNIDVFISKGLKIDPVLKIRRYYETPARGIGSRLLTVFTGHLHRHVRAVRRQLKESNADYDLIVFNNSKTSTGIIGLAKKKGIKVMTIHHNVELEFVRDNTPNLFIRTVLLKYVSKAERSSYLKSDYNLFLTRQDMENFHKLYGKCKGIESVIGTFEFKNLPKWIEKETDVNHLTFALTGSLCTVQGIDGIKYFFDDLYDALPPESKIIVSGRAPTGTVVDLCRQHSNVTLVADPDDMNEVINQADVYICPTRLGGGLKLRVMDALKLGIPVITHECSSRGYDVFVEDGGVLVFKNKEEFDVNLKKLIGMIKTGRINRRIIRRKYEQEFSYVAGSQRMLQVIEKNV